MKIGLWEWDLDTLLVERLVDVLQQIMADTAT